MAATPPRCCRTPIWRSTKARTVEGTRRSASSRRLRAALENRMSLLGEVRIGTLMQRFRPYYQPIVSLRDGRVRGCEALMRWEHPERGLLTPGAFLPAFDDAELALKLGERLMECVLADFQQLEAAGSRPAYIGSQCLERGLAASRSRRAHARPARRRRHAALAAVCRADRNPASSASMRSRSGRRSASCMRPACASRSTISAPAMPR